MKKVSLYLSTFCTKFLSIACVMCFAFDGQAQSIRNVTPNNLDESALEIKNLYGEAIQVSWSKIKDFYLDHWTDTSPYSNSCVGPNPSPTAANDTNISFAWENTGAISYRASYLNLSSGATDRIGTLENGISLDLDNDLYLFAFQAKCEDFLSALSIIIIEKPILFDYLSNCNCPRYTEIWNSSFDENDPAIYDWNLYNTTQRFFIALDYLTSPSVSFVAEIQFGMEGPEIVTLNPACMTNVELNADGTQLFAYDGAVSQGVFGFSHELNGEDGEEGNAQLSFSVSAAANESSGKIYLSKCKRKSLLLRNTLSKTSSDTQPPVELTILKNPTRDVTTILYASPGKTPLTIDLFNANGVRIQTFNGPEELEKGLQRIPLDLSTVPSGLYYGVLKTDYGTERIRLVKID